MFGVYDYFVQIDFRECCAYLVCYCIELCDEQPQQNKSPITDTDDIISLPENRMQPNTYDNKIDLFGVSFFSLGAARFGVDINQFHFFWPVIMFKMKISMHTETNGNFLRLRKNRLWMRDVLIEFLYETQRVNVYFHVLLTLSYFLDPFALFLSLVSMSILLKAMVCENGVRHFDLSTFWIMCTLHVLLRNNYYIFGTNNNH